MWVVMKAMTWQSVKYDKVGILTPKKGEGQPQRFIPVFDERKDAEMFAGEDEQHLIAEVKAIQ